MARVKGVSANLNAFLDMLAVSEGTSTHPLTKDDGYDVIVSGIENVPYGIVRTTEVFTDYTKHPFSNRPAKRINNKGLFSSASGRYQFMFKDYEHYTKLLKLDNLKLWPNGAFSPEAQDARAIQLIRERHALPMIEAGEFRKAVTAVSNLWASLPGANYKDQKMHDIQKLEYIYLTKGGKLWNTLSAQSLQQLPQYLEHTKSALTEPVPKPLLNIELQPTTPKPQGFWSLITKLLKRN